MYVGVAPCSGPPTTPAAHSGLYGCCCVATSWAATPVKSRPLLARVLGDVGCWLTCTLAHKLLHRERWEWNILANWAYDQLPSAPHGTLKGSTPPVHDHHKYDHCIVATSADMSSGRGSAMQSLQQLLQWAFRTRAPQCSCCTLGQGQHPRWALAPHSSCCTCCLDGRRDCGCSKEATATYERRVNAGSSVGASQHSGQSVRSPHSSRCDMDPAGIKRAVTAQELLQCSPSEH